MLRSSQRAMLVIALTFAASPLLAQRIIQDDDWTDRCHRWNRDRDNYCESRQYGFRAPRGRIEVDGRQNGGVSIIGWDRDSVDVIARVQATADDLDEARALAKEIEVSVANGRISADGPSTRRRMSRSVSYEIRVPRAAALDLRAYNGGIKVRDVTGDVEMEAHNGPISVVAGGGNIRGRTQNGPITAELTGTRWQGAGLDLETTNGPVTLEIPERYAARLEAGTTNGPMTTDFPITVQGRIGRRIETTFNGGGPTIRMITTNGPIALRR